MRQNILLGALFIVVSEFLLAGMSAVIKVLSASTPEAMLVFFRNFFGLLVLLPLVARQGLGSLATRVPHLHLLRATAGVSAMYCFFYTIGHMALAEALLFKLTAPFFIPLVALMWLGEGIPTTARVAIGLGFVGVAFILQPGSGGLQAVAFVGLAGALLAGLAKVTIRRMSRTEPATRIVFWFGTLATLISAVPLLWSWETPAPETLAWLLAMGASATAAQLLLTRAYALAPAGQLGPFTYVSVVFGALLGWLFWGEYLDMATFLGMFRWITAGILTTRGGRRSPPRPADREAAHG
ncbi:MAG: DMT family transporter [Ectothiorhodospiraceae bacterium]